MNFKFEEMAYHRNGVGGTPFWVVKFKEQRTPMLAIVFDGHARGIAVFNRSLLAADVISKGENQFRSDYYEVWLSRAIEEHKDAYFEADGLPY